MGDTALLAYAAENCNKLNPFNLSLPTWKLPKLSRKSRCHHCCHNIVLVAPAAPRPSRGGYSRNSRTMQHSRLAHQRLPISSPAHAREQTARYDRSCTVAARTAIVPTSPSLARRDERYGTRVWSSSVSFITHTAIVPTSPSLARLGPPPAGQQDRPESKRDQA